MAHVSIQHHHLGVKLNVVERVMALRRNVLVPLTSIESVSVLSHPVSLLPGPMADVTMGFAASGAPLAHLATVGPRAKYRDGQALVIVWANRPSVAIELNPTAGRWRLLVLSVTKPQAVAQAVESALQ